MKKIEAEFAFKLLNDISPRSNEYTTDEILDRESKRVLWTEDDSEKRMNDLKQVGYSPEVARAIVQNENQFTEEH